jgi:iron(III) transport system permease protein
MSTQVMGTTLRPQLARRRPRMRLRLDHVIMAAAIVALIVLVVMPLAFLLIGSFRSAEGASLDHFNEIFRGVHQLSTWEAWWNFLTTGRGGGLYLSALRNSLVLGALSGLFSLLIGLPLAWAVARTDVPAKAMFQLTATLSYLSPPFLTAIALTYLFSPNAGLSNVLMRDVLGLPWLTFNV